MGKNWAGNSQKGKQGFQKTTRKAAAPPPGGKRSLLDRLIGRDHSVAVASNPDPVSVSNLDKVYAKYESIRSSVGDDVRCRYCGSKKKHKLMREPDGQVICGLCSRGGEGDRSIKSGEWIAPHPREIREAKKADKQVARATRDN